MLTCISPEQHWFSIKAQLQARHGYFLLVGRKATWEQAKQLPVQMRYLGTFETEEEAARAFDHEALKQRGLNIELNLPHEAEAFMKQLAEEEYHFEARGTFILMVQFHTESNKALE